MKKLILLLIVSVFAFCGCEKNPAGALMYNGLYDSDTSTWANPFIIYRNGDIMSRVQPFDKAIGAYTNIWEKYAHLGNELEAEYSGVSHSGHKSFKIKWSGDPSQEFNNLSNTVNNVNCWLTTTNNGSARDLSMAGYTKISFWCKQELRSGTELVINVFGHGYPLRDLVITSSSDWAYHEIDISSYNSTAVETYISITMQPAGAASSCDGGTVYLDDIRLSK
jgi:hypothetical protein